MSGGASGGAAAAAGGGGEPMRLYYAFGTDEEAAEKIVATKTALGNDAPIIIGEVPPVPGAEEGATSHMLVLTITLNPCDRANRDTIRDIIKAAEKLGWTRGFKYVTFGGTNERTERYLEATNVDPYLMYCDPRDGRGPQHSGTRGHLGVFGENALVLGHPANQNGPASKVGGVTWGSSAYQRALRRRLEEAEHTAAAQRTYVGYWSGKNEKTRRQLLNKAKILAAENVAARPMRAPTAGNGENHETAGRRFVKQAMTELAAEPKESRNAEVVRRLRGYLTGRTVPAGNIDSMVTRIMDGLKKRGGARKTRRGRSKRRRHTRRHK